MKSNDMRTEATKPVVVDITLAGLKSLLDSAALSGDSAFLGICFDIVESR